MTVDNELNSELSRAIEKRDLELIQQILVVAPGSSYFYHRVLDEVSLETFDEIFLSLIDEGKIAPNSEWERERLITKAARRGSLKIVDKLVAAGADVNFVSKNGEYPFVRASAAGDRDIFNYLFPLTAPQLRDPEIPIFADNLRHHKQRHCFCYTKIVHSVADKVVNIKRKTNPVVKINLSTHPEREAALWLAAYWGDEFLADTLLMAGTDCNSQIDYRPFAPNFLEPVLWKHGKNSSGERNCYGLNPWKAEYQALTPLMVAIASGGVTKDITPPLGLSHANVIHLLIGAGADLNLRDCDNDTALFWAISLGWTEIVEVMLQFGASFDVINNIGYSPLMLATYLKHDKIIEQLRLAGASTQGCEQVELIEAIERCDQNRVQVLLEAGVNANASHYQGDKALNLAIMTGQVDICRMLIQAGSDTEFVDNYQRESALLRAVRQGNQEIIQLLISQQANLNVQGKAWGETALIEAVRYCDKDSVRLLVDAGADVNIRDNFGRTALDYVEMKNPLCSIDISTDIGMMLLEAGAIYERE
ncbi:MAG TPA: hypothetical protein DDW76_36545 [Cyanobacteria bacterium UBA11369]|nr:hypothetical protein [Cyanobacteria bacterium UBA11371]HBE36867.1 hypothetical protein [Cyanobacteria bacterium UBA11368]HBE54116.1 hypothetical protein [Cyanobacteria bacterium UBA11369]